MEHIIIDIIYDIEFVKDLFKVYNLDNSCLIKLDNSLSNLEEYLTNQTAENNVVNIENEQILLKKHLNIVDQSFTIH